MDKLYCIESNKWGEPLVIKEIEIDKETAKTYQISENFRYKINKSDLDENMSRLSNRVEIYTLDLEKGLKLAEEEISKMVLIAEKEIEKLKNSYEAIVEKRKEYIVEWHKGRMKWD